MIVQDFIKPRQFLRRAIWWNACCALLLAPQFLLVFPIALCMWGLLHLAVLAALERHLARGGRLTLLACVATGCMFLGLSDLMSRWLSETSTRSTMHFFAFGEVLRENGTLTEVGRWYAFVVGPLLSAAAGGIVTALAWVAAFEFKASVQMNPHRGRQTP